MNNKLIRCIALLVSLAAVLGIAVYFTAGGMNPARKMMKAHPYTFRTEKTVGKEVRDRYVKDKIGIVYTARPKLGEEETDRAVTDYLNAAKEEFRVFTEAQPAGIPRLIFDYTTQKFGYDPAETLFVDDTLHNVEGAQAAGYQTYHYTTPAAFRAFLKEQNILS